MADGDAAFVQQAGVRAEAATPHPGVAKCPMWYRHSRGSACPGRVRRDGSMVDDFLIIKGPNSVHVCNAPSPAATASLEIGRAVADHVPDVRPHTTVAVQNPRVAAIG